MPPGQRRIYDFPVLYIGSIPNRFKLSWNEFLKLPRTVSISDYHCVTDWSRLNNKGEGVKFRTVIERAEPLPEARFATVECDFGYATSLPLPDLSDENILLAYRLDDKDLELRHGWPLRLVVPKKYAYKSARWVRKVKFAETQELGFWEKRGYINTAEPWLEDRYF